MLLIKTGILKNVETKTFDFDLMVMDFNTVISDLKNLQIHMPIKRIFVHTKALKSANINIDDIPSIGLAIDKPDQIDYLYKYNNLNNIPYIQIMTIEAGFQGRPFEIELMNKITQLKRLGYRSKIFIDGGVNESTIDKIISHPNPPDFACCGSYLTKADNIQERVEYLKKMRVY
jgi:pentose-5-phosphate-3-epimerase